MTKLRNAIGGLGLFALVLALPLFLMDADGDSVTVTRSDATWEVVTTVDGDTTATRYRTGAPYLPSLPWIRPVVAPSTSVVL